MSYEYIPGLNDTDEALYKGDTGPKGYTGYLGPTGPQGEPGDDFLGKSSYNIPLVGGREGFSYRASKTGINNDINYYVLETVLGTRLKRVQVTILAVSVGDKPVNNVPFFTLKHKPFGSCEFSGRGQTIKLSEDGQVSYSSTGLNNSELGLFNTFTYYSF